VLNRLQNLSKPPPARDTRYFGEVCGLPNIGINPHILREKKDIPTEDLMRLFGVGNGWSGFRFIACSNPYVRKLILDIWPLCYSKPLHPPGRIITREFCYSICAYT
jgi:hypothetical protein